LSIKLNYVVQTSTRCWQLATTAALAIHLPDGHAPFDWPRPPPPPPPTPTFALPVKIVCKLKALTKLIELRNENGWKNIQTDLIAWTGIWLKST